MNVATRLWLGLGFLVLLVVLLGSVSLVALRSTSRAIDAVLQEHQASLLAARRMSEALEREDGASYALLLGDKSGVAPRKLQEGAAMFKKALDDAKTSIEPEREEQKLLSKIAEAHEGYEGALRAAATYSSVLLYFGDLEPRAQGIHKLIGELEQSFDVSNREAEERVTRVAWASRAWIGIITGLSFVAMIWLANHLQQTLLAPLSSMAEAAHAIGQGHLQRRLHYSKKDELGQLAARLNAMVDTLEAERQKSAEQESVLGQILEAVLDAYGGAAAIVDNTGHVLMSNARFRAFATAQQGVDLALLEKQASSGFQIIRHKLSFREKRSFGELVQVMQAQASGPAPEASSPSP